MLLEKNCYVITVSKEAMATDKTDNRIDTDALHTRAVAITSIDTTAFHDLIDLPQELITARQLLVGTQFEGVLTDAITVCRVLRDRALELDTAAHDDCVTLLGYGAPLDR
jgi:hypothetical protein